LHTFGDLLMYLPIGCKSRRNYINGRGKRARGGGEILIGIGLCIPAFRQKAAFASLLLMLAFTPIHL